MIKLTNRTTYRNLRGDLVCIAGPTANAAVEGQKTFWSIQGDHYAEDGRFVAIRRLPNPSPSQKEREESPYIYESYLAPATNLRTITAIEDTDEARAWWKNFKA